MIQTARGIVLSFEFGALDLPGIWCLRFGFLQGMFSVDSHPLLDLRAFVTRFPQPLCEVPTPHDLAALFSAEAEAPLKSDDAVRDAVRRLLRHGGFRPTGRSKPASEYLLRAAGEGKLSSINLAVDVANIVSLHSGLPISVVDVAALREPLRIAVAGPDDRYVFNTAGQVIDLAGLLCLFDAEGACANAVKDAQRTKTSPATRETLSLVWGTHALPGRAAATETWYRELLGSHDATTNGWLNNRDG
jgi:DNA/RNA-binding domain of Phe-tRNA-synthetase-like protein